MGLLVFSPARSRAFSPKRIRLVRQGWHGISSFVRVIFRFQTAIPAIQSVRSRAEESLSDSERWILNSDTRTSAR